MELALPAGKLAQALSSKNIVTVGADGTFNVTIIIDQSWHTGQHTIRASERTFPRSAVITITVHLPGEVPTPSPTSSDTATTSPSATASTTPSGLSCVNPTSLTLGPVSENYTQAVSTQVSLCTSGSGTVNWTASWDQNQAPWLQLDQSTGKIQAPGQQQINVSTLAANLKAGTYTSMVTFSSQQNATPQTLNVTFIVQAGCIRTNQQQYSFTGEASISDPQAQTVTVSNCGNIGTWSTSISTDNNVNWLSIAPTSGALNSGGTQSVTIKASNLNTHLGAGTYTGKILFNIGANQSIVSVTLKVVSVPKLIVVTPNPPAFNAGKDCTLNQNLKAWICIATIANSSNTLSVNWKSSSTGVSNITFKPASDTLPPAGQERVIITIPQNNCQIPTTLTFTGPANSQNISWSCTSPQ